MHTPCRGQIQLPGAVLVVALLAVSVSPRASDSVRLAQYQDAFVDFDNGSGEWIIGNDEVSYTIRINRDRSITLTGLTITGRSDPVTLDDAPDALVTIDGETVRLGEAGSGFMVVGIDPAVGTHFVSLSVRFASSFTPIAVTRRYLVYPKAPAIEMWTDFESSDAETHTVENLNAYALTIPEGDIEVVSGLDAPESEGGSFTRRARSLRPGERLNLGSPTLSTEVDMPYFSVGHGDRRVFSGLLWSGAWSATIERQGDRLGATLGLPPMSAWVGPGRSVEGPHAFIGAVRDIAGAQIAGTTAFVRAGRAGREFPALTTYNTWFVHGINVSERIVRRDINLAADLGIELLQLDAGWYTHESPQGAFDFTDGLGTWEADPFRFPSGLGDLAEYAREQGVKFGLWVEPERVSIDTVGRPDLAQELFLAQQDGAYLPGVPNDEARDAQICLADPAARAWVTRRLIQLIETVRPDNLKWDFNRWVTCTRPGHSHPIDGGNYEHTRGLYEILATLRERFPSLTIENCAGGGHRLDFALARLTDTAWMDDRSAPSAHVRRNLEGLLTVFPAPYLFSYVMAHSDEQIRGAEDIPLLVRSRLPGVVGLAADLGDLPERELNELHQQFTLVKSLRPLQAGAISYPLTSQRPGPGEWEVVQQLMPETGASLVFAFSYGAIEPIVVSPRGIRPDLTYELRSADRGTIGQVHGRDLIDVGLTIDHAPESAAQVLVLEPTTISPSAKLALSSVLSKATVRSRPVRSPQPRR